MKNLFLIANLKRRAGNLEDFLCMELHDLLLSNSLEVCELRERVCEFLAKVAGFIDYFRARHRTEVG